MIARDFVHMNRGIFEGLHKNMINGPERRILQAA